MRTQLWHDYCLYYECMEKGQTITLSGNTYYCVDVNSRSVVFSREKDGKPTIRLTREELKYIKSHKK